MSAACSARVTRTSCAVKSASKYPCAASARLTCDLLASYRAWSSTAPGFGANAASAARTVLSFAPAPSTPTLKPRMRTGSPNSTRIATESVRFARAARCASPVAASVAAGVAFDAGGSESAPSGAPRSLRWIVIVGE